MIDAKIGFLGGGNMAGALVKGLLASGVSSADRLQVSDVSAERRAELEAAHGIRTSSDNLAVVDTSEIVVLAVKPQVVPRVLTEVGAALAGKLLVSIAAGISTATLAERVPASARLVRTMPNTPALVLAGITAIAAGPRATAADLATTRALFDAVGRSVLLDEGQLDAVTGLSGSGPAYALLVIEALADGGVRMGLPRDTAQLLAAQTVYGSAKMLLDTSEHPARLKDRVTSPGGTTIAGLYALERAGVRFAMMDAVGSATERSVALGRGTKG
jgi:pyrroline-5-carboxylate reductase